MTDARDKTHEMGCDGRRLLLHLQRVTAIVEVLENGRAKFHHLLMRWC